MTSLSPDSCPKSLPRVIILFKCLPVSHAHDDHPDVGRDLGEGQEAVAAHRGQDGQEAPSDILANLVQEQTQQRRHRSRDEVDQTDDRVSLLTRETEPGLEKVLRQGDKREDGAIVGETRQGQEPE